MRSKLRDWGAYSLVVTECGNSNYDNPSRGVLMPDGNYVYNDECSNSHDYITKYTMSIQFDPAH